MPVIAPANRDAFQHSGGASICSRGVHPRLTTRHSPAHDTTRATGATSAKSLDTKDSSGRLGLPQRPSSFETYSLDCLSYARFHTYTPRRRSEVDSDKVVWDPRVQSHAAMEWGMDMSIAHMQLPCDTARTRSQNPS